MGTEKPEVVHKVIASKDSWIEGEAIRQLEETARLRGMVRAIGMPDLHPGKGNPVGAAFISEGRIYPHLVGNDIGCGMALWQTDLPCQKFKPEKMAKRLKGLDGPWKGDLESWLIDQGWPDLAADEAMGTIGGGNHFAEFLETEDICDQTLFDRSGLRREAILLLVHSGSRGLGEAILRRHVATHRAEGLDQDSPEFAEYLTAHDRAITWAEANRRLIAERFLNCVNGQGRQILDLTHNSVVTEPIEGGWLHRKGAAPSDQGMVIIPGSRGSLSYLVQPVGDQRENGWSLAHGAGRKWKRSECKARLSGRFRPEALKRTGLKGVVVCESRDLLYEEAPESYKDIHQVVCDLVDHGLVKVVASLRPRVSYKTRRS